MSRSRGALIVIEGIDRTGKTTQCKQLVEKLSEQQISAKYLNFPNRTTDIGQLINSYLTCQKELSNEAIHLLFSANRWECSADMQKQLSAGVTLIVDRYCYSGVAFSAAKGLSIDWCKSTDCGLPKPDRVFFLTTSSTTLQNREGFGDERYEVPDFQKEVYKCFMTLKEDNWEIICADRTIEELNEELLTKTRNIIEEVKDIPLTKIWKKENSMLCSLVGNPSN